MIFHAEAPYVSVNGRTLYVDQVRYLAYSGSSISFRFTGKRASARIISDSPDWESTLKGYAAVYLDEQEQPSKRICLDAADAEYILYEAEEVKTVTVRLVKYSEAAFGTCGVKEISIDTDLLELPPKSPERRIEIIGDSITCGYGVEAPNEQCSFDTAQENPASSYSLLLGKLLEAQTQLISWSGIGIISCYVPEDVNEPLNDWLMPMLYRYTDASGSKRLFGEDRTGWEEWDFEAYRPELIVVNLGTNDASYCREISERNTVFQKEYECFLRFVAEKNPDAVILCVLGTMDQRLCQSVEQAVLTLRQENYQQIHWYHLPLQATEDGLGADYHPSAVTQEKTACLLSAKIKELMKW